VVLVDLNNVPDFDEYIEFIQENSTEQNYKMALDRIRRAMEAFENNLRCIWILDVNRTILYFRFREDIDRKRLMMRMIKLRTYAIEYLDDLEDLEIDVYYLLILYYFLFMQLQTPENFLEYEYIVEELYSFMEEGYCEYVEEDVFTIGNLSMAYINALKGRLLKEEKYLDFIYQKYRNKKDITLDAIIGLYDFANVKNNLGKIQEAAKVYEFLLDVLISEKTIYFMCSKQICNQYLEMIFQCVIEAEVLLYHESGELNKAASMLEQILFEGKIRDKFENGVYWPLYVKYLECIRLSKTIVKEKYLVEIEEILAGIDEIYLKEAEQTGYLVMLDIGKYHLYSLKGNREAIYYIDRVYELLHCLDITGTERQFYIRNMATILRIYRYEGFEEKISDCAKDLLNNLFKFYSMSELDDDNKKLELGFNICNEAMLIAYTVLMRNAPLREKLEYRLNYKNLLPIMIHLRNRFADPSIRDKKRNQLKYYTSEQLMQVIPENSIIIDCLFINEKILDKTVMKSEYYSESTLEVALINRGCNSAYIASVTIDNVQYLFERLEKFLKIIQSKSNKYKKVGKELYDLLFVNFSAELFQTEHIFISPDYILTNVPFNLILESGGIKSHNEIIYINSLRNFFNKSGNYYTSNYACIVGEPDYEINRELKVDLEPQERASLERELPYLPYSGYEVLKIANELSTSCYRKKQASKYVIHSGYRYLHIATHGLVPVKSENPWYESTLAFAGASDYLISGKVYEGYGNGVLSAEEISRMKLDKTELVVLSACNSGKSLFSENQQQVGLQIAFGATGVKYIISALWEVNDLATVFFMTFFYRELDRKHSVTEALFTAKMSLKKMKVWEILDIVKKDQFLCSAITDELIEWLEEFPKEQCIYDTPSYWDAFICYQYKF